MILRNAGGQVTTLLNDILALETLLTFEEVVIIHHTDCGTTYFTNEELRSTLFARDAEAAEAAGVADAEFGAIGDLKEGVVRDVQLLRGCGLVREALSIRGLFMILRRGVWKRWGIVRTSFWVHTYIR